MSRKKISTTIYLAEEQLIALKAVTIATGVPMAFMFRKAVDDYIDKMIAEGKLDRELVNAVNINPEAFEKVRTSRLNPADMNEQTVERVLRRLLAEKGSDA